MFMFIFHIFLLVLSASQWEQRKINYLNAELYDKICDELNIINCGKDYKTLAGRMGYNVNEVKKFERHENPSDALLSHWGKKRGNTVIKLIEILKNMENDAAAEILEKARGKTSIIIGKCYWKMIKVIYSLGPEVT